MVGEAGLEPATTGLEGRCSIQLSYSPWLPFASVGKERKWPRSQSIVTEASASACFVAHRTCEIFAAQQGDHRFKRRSPTSARALRIGAQRLDV